MTHGHMRKCLSILTEPTGMERAGFYFILGIMCVVIWAYPYVLTFDGAAHAANARIIVELLTGECPVAARLFQLNPHILPNWTGHAFMAALIYTGLPASVAEKILFTLCLLLTATGFRMLVRTAKGNPLLSWPVLTLSLGGFLTGGAYNYMLGVGLGFIFLALYIDHRIPPRAARLVGISLLLVLIWLSHIIAFLMCGLFVMIHELLLWRHAHKIDSGNQSLPASLGLHIRKNSGMILAFLPAMMLTVYYLSLSFSQVKVDYGDSIGKGLNLLYLVSLYDFVRDYTAPDMWQFTAMLLLGAVSLFFLGKQIVSRTTTGTIESAALICAFSLWAMSFFTQSAVNGGWLLDARLRTLGWCFAFLTLGLSGTHTRNQFFAYVCILLAAINIIDFSGSARRTQEIYRALTKDMPAITDHSLIYTLNLPGAPATPIWAYGTIPRYLSLDKKCTYDLSNYEASLDYFPVRYRTNIVAETLYQLPYFKDRDVNLLAWLKMDNVSRTKFEERTGLKIDYVFQLGDAGRMLAYTDFASENIRLYHEKYAAGFYKAIRTDVLKGFEPIHRFTYRDQAPFTIFKRSGTNYKE